MRPVRLELTAWGPFARTEIIDFNALAPMGLFVIAGKTGAGKTSIFDAMHYALYGSLPGRRSTYKHLRSDHAAASTACSVALDFEVAGQRWRVERTPRQRRPKQRSTGWTEVQARATLSRFEDNAASAVANSVSEVNKRCASLVGLSSRQFERVVLLPQGEFSRMLTATGRERAEILRALFDTGAFKLASVDLKRRADAATAHDESERASIERRLIELANDISELDAAPGGADLDESPSACSTAQLRACIEVWRSQHIAGLRDRAVLAEKNAAAATDAVRDGESAAAQVRERDRLEAELALAQSSFDLDGTREQLRLARAAVPVVASVRHLASATAHLAASQHEVDRLASLASDHLSSAGMATVASHDTTTTSAAIGRVESAIGELTDERDRLDAQERLQNEIDDLVGRLQQTAARIERLRLERRDVETSLSTALSERAQLQPLPAVDELATDHERLVRASVVAEALRDVEVRLRASRSRADDTSNEIERLTTSISELDEQADTSLDLHREREALATRRVELTAELSRFGDLERLAEEIEQARRNESRARQAAGTAIDRYLAGTARRLAETLVDGEPCPVCGSCEHPLSGDGPDLDGDDPVSEAAVEQTRAAHLEARSVVDRLEQRALEIRGLTSSASAAETQEQLDAITTAEQRLRERVASAARRAHERDQYDNQLTRARGRAASLNKDLHRLESNRAELRGRLDDLAEIPPDELTARIAAVEHRLSAARQAVSTSGALDKRIDILKRRAASQAGELRALEDDEQSTAPALASARARRADLDLVDRERSDVDHQLTAAQQARDVLVELRSALVTATQSASQVDEANRLIGRGLADSGFADVEAAQTHALTPQQVEQLEASVAQAVSTRHRIQAQLDALTTIVAPEDLDALHVAAAQASEAHKLARQAHIQASTTADHLTAELDRLDARQNRVGALSPEARRLIQVGNAVSGDNERSTPLENWVLGAHLRDVVELANLRLAKATRHRFQLRVSSDCSDRRSHRGLDLDIEDTVTGSVRPTVGLSGGELFQTSLALALGLADVVTRQQGGIHIDALFVDEGFGSLDEDSVERAVDLLDDLRQSGSMIGVITHVPALLQSLPRGLTVATDTTGVGSVIHRGCAA